MKNLSNCNEMYSCSICGRYCQDAKKLELHTLGMAFKGDIFSDDKSCLTILPLWKQKKNYEIIFFKFPASPAVQNTSSWELEFSSKKFKSHCISFIDAGRMAFSDLSNSCKSSSFLFRNRLIIPRILRNPISDLSTLPQQNFASVRLQTNSVYIVIAEIEVVYERNAKTSLKKLHWHEIMIL